MIARRLLGPVAVSALLAGCVLASPDFDDPAEGTGTTDPSTSDSNPSSAGTMSDSAGSVSQGNTTDGSVSEGSDSDSSDSVTSDSSDSTSSDSTTSDSTTSDSTTSDGTTSDGTTSDGTTSEGTTSEGTTTGGVQPGTYDLPPSVSTCVLLQYQQAPYSKQACLASADEQVPGENDLVIVDTAVGMGMGMNRRAEAFFQFMIPADYENATISSATLRIRTPQTPYVPAPEGGQLVLTGAYSEASLETNVPAALQNIGPKKGEIPNQPVWIEWSVPPELLVSGQPLHLALMPTNQFGVFYRRNTAILRVVVD